MIHILCNPHTSDWFLVSNRSLNSMIRLGDTSTFSALLTWARWRFGDNPNPANLPLPEDIASEDGLKNGPFVDIFEVIRTEVARFATQNNIHPDVWREFLADCARNSARAGTLGVS